MRDTPGPQAPSPAPAPPSQVARGSPVRGRWPGSCPAAPIQGLALPSPPSAVHAPGVPAAGRRRVWGAGPGGRGLGTGLVLLRGKRCSAKLARRAPRARTRSAQGMGSPSSRSHFSLRALPYLVRVSAPAPVHDRPSHASHFHVSRCTLGPCTSHSRVQGACASSRASGVGRPPLFSPLFSGVSMQSFPAQNAPPTSEGSSGRQEDLDPRTVNEWPEVRAPSAARGKASVSRARAASAATATLR